MTVNFNDEQSVADYTAGSKSMHEWNTRTEEVREANLGLLPPYWEAKFILSGWFEDLKNSWDSNLREDNEPTQ